MARGANPTPRYRSALEADYAVALEASKRAGDLAWWGYECWRFELGADAWYKPDFAVMRADGTIELHETKGFVREAARVRLAAAVQRYPMFRWLLVKRGSGTMAFTLEML